MRALLELLSANVSSAGYRVELFLRVLARLPHVARLAPNVLTGSGYSGSGVALANMTGKLLADTVRSTASGFDVMERIPTTRFPGGPMMRWPLLVLAMTWYSLRDRI